MDVNVRRPGELEVGIAERHFGGQMAAVVVVDGCEDAALLLGLGTAIAKQHKEQWSVRVALQRRSFRSMGDNPRWVEDARLVLDIGCGGNCPTEAMQMNWLEKVMWSAARTLAGRLPRHARINVNVYGFSPD